MSSRPQNRGFIQYHIILYSTTILYSSRIRGIPAFGSSQKCWKQRAHKASRRRVHVTGVYALLDVLSADWGPEAGPAGAAWAHHQKGAHIYIYVLVNTYIYISIYIYVYLHVRIYIYREPQMVLVELLL